MKYMYVGKDSVLYMRCGQSLFKARDIRQCGITALCAAHDVSLVTDIHVTTLYPQV